MTREYEETTWALPSPQPNCNCRLCKIARRIEKLEKKRG